MGQYIGIDLHRKRSVLVRMDEDGEVLETRRLENDNVAGFSDVIGAAGDSPEVVVEATYGWYWLADLLTAWGCTVHLAHPLGVKAFAYQRVKKDETDAQHLADLLRMKRLHESWLAPSDVRSLRERVRHRAKLVGMRSSVRAQVHAILAKEGVRVPMTDVFGKAGRQLLSDMKLSPAFDERAASLVSIQDAITDEVVTVEHAIVADIGVQREYRAVQTVPGVGPVLGAVLIAEIGDIHRFPTPDALCSWAGLTPRHHESDRTVHRGRITKQGSMMVRWAVVEAAHRLPAWSPLRQHLRSVEERRGSNIAAVAIARKLLRLVFYAMRDGALRAPRSMAAAA